MPIEPESSDLVYTFIFHANRLVGWFEDKERATCFAMQIASSLGTRFKIQPALDEKEAKKPANNALGYSLLIDPVL